VVRGLVGLQPRGSEVIDRLGALGDLPTRAVRIGPVVVHVNGRRVASLPVGQPTRLVTRPGLLVSQAEIEAGHSMLDSYRAERRPVATEVPSSTTAMTRLVLGDSPVARQVRDHVFVPLTNRPRVQRLIWEKASQLEVSYRRHAPRPPRRARRWRASGSVRTV